MPTFDFQCQKCKTVFEFARPFGASVLPKCPACGSKRTEKLLTPPTIQFKGKGFYKTDSRKPQKAESQEPKTPVKTEPKPEAKKDAPEKK